MWSSESGSNPAPPLANCAAGPLRSLVGVMGRAVVKGYGAVLGIVWRMSWGGRQHRKGTQGNLGPMQRLTLWQKHTSPIPTAEQLSALDLSILTHSPGHHSLCGGGLSIHVYLQCYTANSGLAEAAFTASQRHPLPQPSWLRDGTSLPPPPGDPPGQHPA